MCVRIIYNTHLLLDNLLHLHLHLLVHHTIDGHFLWHIIYIVCAYDVPTNKRVRDFLLGATIAIAVAIPRTNPNIYMYVSFVVQVGLFCRTSRSLLSYISIPRTNPVLEPEGNAQKQ